MNPGKQSYSPPPNGKPGNHLFRNELNTAEKPRFTDGTDQAGVGHVGYDMSVAVGDYDNDGDIDVLLTNNGPVRLLLNQSSSDAHWLQVRLEAPEGNRFGIEAEAPRALQGK